MFKTVIIGAWVIFSGKIRFIICSEITKVWNDPEYSYF